MTDDFHEARAKAAAVINGQPLPPPPATPTPAPQASPGMGQFNDLMQTMIGIETWKAQILANDRAREAQIEARIRSQLEKQMEMQLAYSVDGGQDPIMQEAAHELILAFREGRASNRNRSPPAQKPAQPAPTSNQPKIVAPAPSNAPNAQESEKMTISQDMADYIADKIEDRMPEKCKAARRGEISKEDAIKMIVDGGAKPDDAMLIYESIMAVDEEESAQDPAPGAQ